jgi:hypothetical protein
MKGKRLLLAPDPSGTEAETAAQRPVCSQPPLKAYLLKESLEQLWSYRYEGAALRHLQN